MKKSERLLHATGNSGISATLDDIAALLNGIDENSFDELLEIKKTLSKILKTVSGIVGSLITNAIKKIDDITKKQADDPRETFAAMGRMISVAASHCETDAEPAADAVPNGDNSDAPGSDSAGFNRPVTLDDVAALLNSIDENSLDELLSIKKALSDILKTSSELVGSLISDVIKKIDSITEKQAGDPEETLAAIGRIIDAATTYYEIEPPSAPAPAVKMPDAAVLPAAAETVPDRVHDEETLREFISESAENIETAEMALLNLESNPSDAESINSIFRAIHTIKGSSAYLNLNLISELAHHAESMLVKIRDGALKYDSLCSGIALRVVDALKEMIVKSGCSMKSKPSGYDELIRNIINYGTLAVSGDGAGKQVSFAEPRKDQAPSVKNSAEEGKDTSVRIRTEKLDRLIDTVGEIVIAHSMVLQDRNFKDTGSDELSNKVMQVGNLVRELQDISMSMRMVQFKSSFQKMSRLVHDLSHKMSKSIEFETIGSDTEVDRNIVDIINEALVHMVRNAIDHGIEMPDEREAAGKNPKGKITLSACHANGYVVVDLKDDGRGLNCQKILDKARALGIVNPDANLPPESIYNLILEPGFSTADKVTDVSGRGVGMDVVKQSIERLRGSLKIESSPGMGSRFILKMPLTMAVTDGMLISVGNQRFIVPTHSVQTTFRPEKDMLFTVSGRETAVMLQNIPIPIVSLCRVFEIPGAIENPLEGIIMVIENSNSRIALLVDEIIGQYQFVAKSLGDIFKNVSGISGGAILGDGRVGLIIDPMSIVS